MNYPYYTNAQYRIDNLQQLRNKIDNQIMQEQQFAQQPTPITQNFQLASNNNGNFKIINNINDVQNDLVMTDTYFLANDFSTLWQKNVRGEIKTFTLQEVKPKDEKDIMIENLQKQIDELKGANNVKSNTEQSTTSNGIEIATTKSTSIPISKSSKTK